MIASNLLYYNPFLLIEVNCYERARLTLAECCSQDRKRDSTDAREGFRVYVRGYSGKYFRGNVRATEENCATVLRYAAANGQLEATRLLISKGAHLNAKDRGGFSPLNYAIMNNNESPVRLLLGERAHVQVVHNGIDASGLAADGKATSHDFKRPIESALHDVAAHGHVGMLQLL